jgi:t-SNARE complex subunit (syntaxin)
MFVRVQIVSAMMLPFRTLKELRRRALNREREARIKGKLMNWLIFILILVIIGVGLNG